MASNFCNISFSWRTTDKSPTSVIKFTYLDLTDFGNEEAPNIQNDRLTEDLELQSETQLLLTRDGSDEDSKHCILQLRCPNIDFAQINGFLIVSESRTIEVSNEDQGYLTTIRGKKIDSKSESTSQTGCDMSSSSSMYICSCYFKEGYPSLSLKFLSLGEQSAFCVQRVEVNILQHGIQSPPAKGSLDVSKLKKDIADMGGTMSDRAKDFMATLEQYEKNKTGGGGGGFLSAAMSNPMAGGSTNGLSSIMSSILGAGTMKSLAGSGVGSDGDNQDIYKILNSVCGSISSQRVASVKQAAVPSEAGPGSTGKVSDVGDEEGLESQNMELVTSVVTEKMSKLKADMQDELSEIKQEMNAKIDDVKSELNGKLDAILNLLGSAQSAKDNT